MLSKKYYLNNKKIKQFLSYPDKIYGLNSETFFKNIFFNFHLHLL